MQNNEVLLIIIRYVIFSVTTPDALGPPLQLLVAASAATVATTVAGAPAVPAVDWLRRSFEPTVGVFRRMFTIWHHERRPDDQQTAYTGLSWPPTSLSSLVRSRSSAVCGCKLLTEKPSNVLSNRVVVRRWRVGNDPPLLKRQPQFVHTSAGMRSWHLKSCRRKSAVAAYTNVAVAAALAAAGATAALLRGRRIELAAAAAAAGAVQR